MNGAVVINDLEALRLKGQRSVQEWAEMLGVNRGTYYSWRSGKRAPNLQSLRGIATRCPELRATLFSTMAEGQPTAG